MKKPIRQNASDLPSLSPGSRVFVKPHTLGDKSWVIQAERKEPRSYEVRMDHGGTVRRNRRDLKHHNHDEDLELFDYPTETDPTEQIILWKGEEQEPSEPANSGTMTRSGRISKPPECFGW